MWTGPGEGGGPQPRVLASPIQPQGPAARSISPGAPGGQVNTTASWRPCLCPCSASCDPDGHSARPVLTSPPCPAPGKTEPISNHTSGCSALVWVEAPMGGTCPQLALLARDVAQPAAMGPSGQDAHPCSQAAHPATTPPPSRAHQPCSFRGRGLRMASGGVGAGYDYFQTVHIVPHLLGFSKIHHAGLSFSESLLYP